METSGTSDQFPWVVTRRASFQNCTDRLNSQISKHQWWKAGPSSFQLTFIHSYFCNNTRSGCLGYCFVVLLSLSSAHELHLPHHWRLNKQLHWDVQDDLSLICGVPHSSSRREVHSRTYSSLVSASSGQKIAVSQSRCYHLGQDHQQTEEKPHTTSINST